MGLAEIAAEIEAVNREIVYRQTWGHLDASVGIKYPGVIVFAEGIYGNDGVATLRCDFGPDAGDGPWFYEGLQDWLHEQKQKTEPGRVYRFDGWYRLCKNGRHQFAGKVRALEMEAITS